MNPLRIGVVTPDPGHQLLADTARLLRAAGHRVDWLHPRDPAPADTCDAYLLKARTPEALALGRELEARGAPVVNSTAATARCRDRVALADTARRAGLPYAPTLAVTTPARLAAEPWTGRPLVLKSRWSRRGDLVARADTPDALRDLARRWPEEPVVVQEFVPNDGWDRKLWSVAGHAFGALRRSELTPDGKGPNLPLTPLPAAWTALLRTVGTAFALDVHGVDLVVPVQGPPLIVDINAFPGARDQPGAPEALAELAVTRARGA